MNVIIKWLQYTAVLFFINFINLVPFKLSFQISRGIGLLLYLFDGRHRKAALENLKASFPEKGDAEILRMAKESFKNIGCIIAELARIFKYGEEWLKDTVEFQGRENIEMALKKGKGVLVMSGHIGNWEIGALAIGREWKFNSVVRHLDNKFLNKILYKIRTVFDNGVISKKNALKEVLKCLKRNEIVAILMDQNTSLEDGVFVDFFGRKACTTPVVALIALRTGTPVIPTFAVREETGKIRVIAGEEIKILQSEDYRRDIEKYTAIFTGEIESVIKKYPEQWLWLHRRWKTQP